MLAYKHFEINPSFANELNVVLKCPDCSHIFSPALSLDDMRIIVAANGPGRQAIRRPSRVPAHV